MLKSSGFAACRSLGVAPSTQPLPGTLAVQSLQQVVQPVQQPPVRTRSAVQVLQGRLADWQLHCVQYVLDGFQLTFRETKPVITLDNATCVAYQIMRASHLPLASGADAAAAVSPAS